MAIVNHEKMFEFIQKLLLVVITSNIISCGGNLFVPGLPKKHFKKEGEFKIGVMLPIHALDKGSFCSSQVTGLNVLQRLEAVSFTIDEINRRTDLLNNTSLGFVVFDDCNKDVTALAQCLRFRKSGTRTVCGDGKGNVIPVPMGMDPDTCNNSTVTPHDIIGVMACETSSLTIQVANMLTAFKIPQISYMSTSAALSDKNKYPYFQRPIPSDHQQVRVILEILKRFNWKFISVVYSEGSYGTDAFNYLRYQAEDAGICFAETYEVGPTTKRGEYISIVENLMAISNKASVVILIAYLPEVKTILEAYKWMNIRLGVKLTWIASDSWGMQLRELKNIEEWTVGMLSVNIRMSNVERFDKYFTSLTPENKSDNPWLDEHWEYAFGCSNREGYFSCDKNLTFNQSELYYPDMYVSQLMDSIYTYAYALNATIENECQSLSNESLLQCVEENIINYTTSRTFLGETGVVSYNYLGDGLPYYEIMNMQKVNENEYRLHKIGHWDMLTDSLAFNESITMWVNGSVPLSRCSVPCGVAEEPRRREAKCCWDCEKCQSNQIVIGFGYRIKCSTCQKAFWPEPVNRTRCLKIHPRYLRWDGPVGIAFAVICGSGILSSILVLVLYIKNIRNPLIKSCSRELSFIMLTGIILSYILVLTFIGNLTNEMCVLHLFGIGLSFTSMYGPLVTKTNRIYRIFKAGQKTRQRPPFIESRYQVFIAVFIIAIHGLILTVGMAIDAPRVDDKLTSPDIVQRICIFPVVPFVLALVYNAHLVIACAFYAFKTRMLPDNYNESRFIAFCVYSTLFLWLAFVPVYFVIPVGYYRVAVLMIAISSNATVLLICMYVPKLFAIYCVAHDNKIHESPGSTCITTSDTTKPKLRFASKTQIFPISNPVSQIHH